MAEVYSDLKRSIAITGSLFLALQVACLKPDTSSDLAVGPTDARYNSVVQVRFLGVAGFFIRLGSDVVLTAPFYSNPDLAHEAWLPIHPRKDLIDQYHFRKLNHKEDTSDVRAIIVGHAHYDHLMDLPYVWQYSQTSKIVGSQTMLNVLAQYKGGITPDPDFPAPLPDIPASLLVALDNSYLDSRNCAGEDPSPKADASHSCTRFSGSPGKPYDVTPAIRLRGFCARHPDQFPPIHQAPGCQPGPLQTLPTTTRDDYLEGESIAYLIDFMDTDTRAIRFRIYYQDVPTDGLFGKVPNDVLREHPVNLALLCAGNWKDVQNEDAVSVVDNLQPRHVLIGHWENFFKTQDHVEEAPLQLVGLFRKLVKDEMARGAGRPAAKNVVLPAPQVLKVYSVGP